MAEIISHVGAGERLPIRRWLDGQARRLVKGEDFEFAHTSTLTQLLRKEAKARGVVIETETHDDYVDVQVVGRIGEVGA